MRISDYNDEFLALDVLKLHGHITETEYQSLRDGLKDRLLLFNQAPFYLAQEKQ